MSFAIRYDLETNRTFYRGMSGIGPMFGGTKETAVRFTTKSDAERFASGPAFDLSFVEVVELGAGEEVK